MILDEEELQRRELARLLETAKDDNRKDLIRKALVALDDSDHDDIYADKFSSKILGPSTQASLFSGKNIPIETAHSARLRPMSARRRPSIPNLLDAIPETMPRTDFTEKTGEFVMPAEDIAEVIASSFDKRCSPKDIFRRSNNSNNNNGNNNNTSSAPTLSQSSSNNSLSSIDNTPGNIASQESKVSSITMTTNNSTNLNISPSSSLNMPTTKHPTSGHSSAMSPKPKLNNRLRFDRGGKKWTSTGLVPQFLTICFFEKWFVRKVEISTSGIESIAVQVNTSLNSAISTYKLIPMDRISKNRFSVSLSDGTESESDSQPAIGISLFIQKATIPFFSILDVSIRVVSSS